MIQDINLYEGMWRFFNSLPSYILGADEQIELVWMTRGENQPSHRECFPALKQASERAIALGPDHDVFLQAVVEPGTTPWNTDSTQLLVGWCARDRKPDDRVSGNDGNAAVTELRSLLSDEPSLAFLQTYLDGAYTCETVWYYYRSLCPIRAGIRARLRSRPTQGDEPGEGRD